jgi:hypothetical protein
MTRRRAPSTSFSAGHDTTQMAEVSSASGLAIGMSLTGNANIPAGTTITAISGATLTLSQAATGTQTSIPTRFSVFPDAQGLGVVGGSPTSTMATANLPPYTPSGSVATSITNNNTSNFNGSAQAGGTQITGNATVIISASSTFTGTAQGGTSIPFSNIPNASITNWAVRLTP